MKRPSRSLQLVAHPPITWAQIENHRSIAQIDAAVVTARRYGIEVTAGIVGVSVEKLAEWVQITPADVLAPESVTGGAGAGYESR